MRRKRPTQLWPTEGDPPPGWVAFRIVRGRNRVLLGRFLGNMRDETFVHGQLTTRRRVVPTIQQQMSLFLLQRRRNSDYDGIQDVHQHLAIMAICPTQHHGERNAFGIGQQRAFTSGFSSVSGVAPRGLRRTSAPLFPRGAFTMLPSAACHAQSIPIF